MSQLKVNHLLDNFFQKVYGKEMVTNVSFTKGKFSIRVSFVLQFFRDLTVLCNLKSLILIKVEFPVWDCLHPYRKIGNVIEWKSIKSFNPFIPKTGWWATWLLIFLHPTLINCQEEQLTFYTWPTVCILFILFSTHLLRRWQGEFV